MLVVVIAVAGASAQKTELIDRTMWRGATSSKYALTRSLD